MAKLRFPGRPVRFDRLSVKYFAADIKNTNDPSLAFLPQFQHGLRLFREIVGTSDEEDEFEGFTETQLQKGEKKLSVVQHAESQAAAHPRLSSSPISPEYQGTRLGHARVSLDSLPTSERTRGRVKAVVRQSYKKLIKEGLAKPAKCHSLVKVKNVDTQAKTPKRGKAGYKFPRPQFKLDYKNDIPGHLEPSGIKKPEKDMAKFLLEKAKQANLLKQKQLQKQRERKLTAQPVMRKQFVLPTQSSRSSRVIKPNKRFLEESLEHSVMKKSKGQGDSPMLSPTDGDRSLDFDKAVSPFGCALLGQTPPASLEQDLILDGKRDRKPSLKLRLQDELVSSETSHFTSPKSSKATLTSPLAAPKLGTCLFSTPMQFQKVSEKQKFGMMGLGSARKQGASIVQKAKLQLNRAAINKSKAALARSLKAAMKKEAKRDAEQEQTITSPSQATFTSPQSSESIEEGQKKLTKPPKKCPVCGKKTELSFSFKVTWACLQCRNFFFKVKHKAARKTLKYRCKFKGNCKILPNNRTKFNCTHCRLVRCVKVGFPPTEGIMDIINPSSEQGTHSTPKQKSPPQSPVWSPSRVSGEAPAPQESKVEAEQAFREQELSPIQPGEGSERKKRKKRAFKELLRIKQEQHEAAIVVETEKTPVQTPVLEVPPPPVSPPVGSVEISPQGGHGPRIKHVCRNAAVVLGKPPAMFPEKSELRLSALPTKDKQQLWKKDEAHKAASKDSDDECPLEEIIQKSGDSVVVMKKSPPIKHKLARKLTGPGGTKLYKRRIRCRQCIGCMTPDCGECRHCMDRPKFGGPGVIKQACMKRQCKNPTIRRSTLPAFINTKKDFSDSGTDSNAGSIHSSPDKRFSDVEPVQVQEDKAEDEIVPGSIQIQPVTGLQSQTGTLLDDFSSKQVLPAIGSMAGTSHAIAAMKGTENQPATRSTGSQIRRLDFGEDATDIQLERIGGTRSGKINSRLMKKLSVQQKYEKDVTDDDSQCYPVTMTFVNPASRQWGSAQSQPRYYPIKVGFRGRCDINSTWNYGMALTMSVAMSVRTLCYLCGSAGKHELLYCNICCEPFHSFCLDEDEQPVVGQEDEWICTRCQFCHVCGGRSNLLQCDKCQNTYHPGCLGPNYPTKPSKKKKIWICTKCVKCKSCGATTPGTSSDATWTYDFSLCYECGKLMDKGNYCPICRKCYSDDDWESKMIQCNLCESWVHSKCEGLTDEMYEILSYLPEDLSFYCRKCHPVGCPEWESTLKREMRFGIENIVQSLILSKSAQYILKLEKKKSPAKQTSPQGQITPEKRISGSRCIRPAVTFHETAEERNSHDTKETTGHNKTDDHDSQHSVIYTHKIQSHSADTDNVEVMDEGTPQRSVDGQERLKVEDNKTNVTNISVDASSCDTVKEPAVKLSCESECIQQKNDSRTRSEGSISCDTGKNVVELTETSVNESKQSLNSVKEAGGCTTVDNSNAGEYGEDTKKHICDTLSDKPGEIHFKGGEIHIKEGKLLQTSKEGDSNQDTTTCDKATESERTVVKSDANEEANNTKKSEVDEVKSSVKSENSVSEVSSVHVTEENIDKKLESPVRTVATIGTGTSGNVTTTGTGTSQEIVRSVHFSTTGTGTSRTVATIGTGISQQIVRSVHFSTSVQTREQPESQLVPIEDNNPKDLMELAQKMKTGYYKSVALFCEDFLRIIQTYLDDDEEVRTSRKKAVASAKSIFVKQMQQVFPWFKLKECRYWYSCKNLPMGMLPDATLPPTTDHTYAQWLERASTPVSPQPSPFKKRSATPIKKYLPIDDDEGEMQPFLEGEDTRRCMFCLQYGDQEANDAGRLLYCGQDDWCHINCALWSAEVYEDANGALKNLIEAHSRGKMLKCDVCQRTGATVGCNTRGCKANYHFMCARRDHCVFQEDKKVFCHYHNSHRDGELLYGKKFKVLRRVFVEEVNIRSVKKSWAKGLHSADVSVLIGSLCVEGFGRLTDLSDKPKYLHPADFLTSRMYWSTRDARRRTVYTCRIIEVRPEALKSPTINIRDMRIVHDETHPEYVPLSTLDLSGVNLNLDSSNSTLTASETIDLTAESVTINMDAETSFHSNKTAGQSVCDIEDLSDTTANKTETLHQSESPAASSSLTESCPAIQETNPKMPRMLPSNSFSGTEAKKVSVESDYLSKSWPVQEKSKPASTVNLSCLSANTLKMLNIKDPSMYMRPIQNQDGKDSDDFGLLKVADRLNSAAARCASRRYSTSPLPPLSLVRRRSASVDKVLPESSRAFSPLMRNERAQSLEPSLPSQPLRPFSPPVRMQNRSHSADKVLHPLLNQRLHFATNIDGNMGADYVISRPRSVSDPVISPEPKPLDASSPMTHSLKYVKDDGSRTLVAMDLSNNSDVCQNEKGIVEDEIRRQLIAEQSEDSEDISGKLPEAAEDEGAETIIVMTDSGENLTDEEAIKIAQEVLDQRNALASDDSQNDSVEAGCERLNAGEEDASKIISNKDEIEEKLDEEGRSDSPFVPKIDNNAGEDNIRKRHTSKSSTGKCVADEKEQSSDEGENCDNAEVGFMSQEMEDADEEPMELDGDNDSEASVDEDIVSDDDDEEEEDDEEISDMDILDITDSVNEATKASEKLTDVCTINESNNKERKEASATEDEEVNIEQDSNRVTVYDIDDTIDSDIEILDLNLPKDSDDEMTEQLELDKSTEISERLEEALANVNRDEVDGDRTQILVAPAVKEQLKSMLESKNSPKYLEMSESLPAKLVDSTLEKSIPDFRDDDKSESVSPVDYIEVDIENRTIIKTGVVSSFDISAVDGVMTTEVYPPCDKEAAGTSSDQETVCDKIETDVKPTAENDSDGSCDTYLITQEKQQVLRQLGLGTCDEVEKIRKSPKTPSPVLSLSFEKKQQSSKRSSHTTSPLKIYPLRKNTVSPARYRKTSSDRTKKDGDTSKDYNADDTASSNKAELPVLDPISKRIKEESLAKSCPEERGPFKCLMCRRLYRTESSYKTHAANCNFYVSSSEEDDNEEDAGKDEIKVKRRRGRKWKVHIGDTLRVPEETKETCVVTGSVESQPRSSLRKTTMYQRVALQVEEKRIKEDAGNVPAKRRGRPSLKGASNEQEVEGAFTENPTTNFPDKPVDDVNNSNMQKKRGRGRLSLKGTNIEQDLENVSSEDPVTNFPEKFIDDLDDSTIQKKRGRGRPSLKGTSNEKDKESVCQEDLVTKFPDNSVDGMGDTSIQKKRGRGRPSLKGTSNEQDKESVCQEDPVAKFPDTSVEGIGDTSIQKKRGRGRPSLKGTSNDQDKEGVCQEDSVTDFPGKSVDDVADGTIQKKRGRGRPPLKGTGNEQDKESAFSEDLVTNSPEKSLGDLGDNSIQKKRGRGRPPLKGTNNEQDIESACTDGLVPNFPDKSCDDSREGTIQKIRGRGRLPLKGTSSEQDTKSALSSDPVINLPDKSVDDMGDSNIKKKRGRGRPRKEQVLDISIETENETLDDSVATDNDIAAETVDDVSISNRQHRKKLREQRQLESQTESSDNSDPEIEKDTESSPPLIQRGRGRPFKRGKRGRQSLKSNNESIDLESDADNDKDKVDGESTKEPTGSLETDASSLNSPEVKKRGRGRGKFSELSFENAAEDEDKDKADPEISPKETRSRKRKQESSNLNEQLAVEASPVPSKRGRTKRNKSYLNKSLDESNTEHQPAADDSENVDIIEEHDDNRRDSSGNSSGPMVDPISGFIVNEATGEIYSPSKGCVDQSENDNMHCADDTCGEMNNNHDDSGDGKEDAGKRSEVKEVNDSNDELQVPEIEKTPEREVDEIEEVQNEMGKNILKCFDKTGLDNNPKTHECNEMENSDGENPGKQENNPEPLESNSSGENQNPETKDSTRVPIENLPKTVLQLLKDGHKVVIRNPKLNKSFIWQKTDKGYIGKPFTKKIVEKKSATEKVEEQKTTATEKVEEKKSTATEKVEEKKSTATEKIVENKSTAAENIVEKKSTASEKVKERTFSGSEEAVEKTSSKTQKEVEKGSSRTDMEIEVASAAADCSTRKNPPGPQIQQQRSSSTNISGLEVKDDSMAVHAQSVNVSKPTVSERRDLLHTLLKSSFKPTTPTPIQPTQILPHLPTTSVPLKADYVGGFVLSSKPTQITNAHETLLNTAPIASNILQNSLYGQGNIATFSNPALQFGTSIANSIPSQYLQGQAQVMPLMNFSMIQQPQQQIRLPSQALQTNIGNFQNQSILYPQLQPSLPVSSLGQMNLNLLPMIKTVDRGPALVYNSDVTVVPTRQIRPALATLPMKPVIRIQPGASLMPKPNTMVASTAGITGAPSSMLKPKSMTQQKSINDIQVVASKRMEKMHQYLAKRKQAVVTRKKMSSLPSNISMLRKSLQGKIMLDAENNGVVIGQISPKLKAKQFIKSVEVNRQAASDKTSVAGRGRKKKLLKRKYVKKIKEQDAISQPHATDKYSHPIIHPQKETTSLPVAAVEEEVHDVPLTSIEDPDNGQTAASSKVNLGHLEYEITSDDGFSCRSDTVDGAWKQVFEKVQDARTAGRMKQLSYAGLSGSQMFGLTHETVVYLVEQLYGANYCRRYKFKYHKHALAEQELELVNPSGCIRTESFTGRNPWDMFSFLMSRYRKLPVRDDKVNNEEMTLKSSRRATSMDLPMAMRFRKLKEHSREAVGVYRSTIHGRGLFCKRNIDAGEMIIEYAGEVIRNSMTDLREKYYESKGIGCYMFRIDDMDVVDATMRGSAARFINHSCEPNCYSKVITVDNRKHIVIFAIRQILRGEELTYDYKFPIEEVKILCTCGSKKCRKYLN